MSGHTPGPWFNDNNLWACVTTAPGGLGWHLATCTSVVPPEEQRANARLIAAAPDLLEALKQVGCRSARVYANGNTCAERQAQGETVDHCFVCAAIAKARGGK